MIGSRAGAPRNRDQMEFLEMRDPTGLTIIESSSSLGRPMLLGFLILGTPESHDPIFPDFMYVFRA
jgi:hypothetical protein